MTARNWILAAASIVVLLAVLLVHSNVHSASSKLPGPHWPIDNSSPSAIEADLKKGVLRPTFADLAYADDSPFEKLDLYLPKQRNSLAPLVIWIHGGAFHAGDKRSMPRRNFGPPPLLAGTMQPYQEQVPDAIGLIAKGYAVVSLNYRLASEETDEARTAGFQDGKSAVRFLRANASKYNLDPSKFAVWGNSAGGYIAAILGVTGDQMTIFDNPTSPDARVSNAVQAVVVWFGTIDGIFFPPDIRTVHYIPMAKVLPPFLIAHGDTDQRVPVESARKLNAALLSAGASSTLTILHGAGHSDPAFMATQMIPTFAFLDKVLGRQGDPH